MTPTVSLAEVKAREASYRESCKTLNETPKQTGKLTGRMIYIQQQSFKAGR